MQKYKLVDFDVINTDIFAVGVEFGGEERFYFECWLRNGSLIDVYPINPKNTRLYNLIYFLEPQVLTIIRQAIKEHKQPKRKEDLKEQANFLKNIYNGH